MQIPFILIVVWFEKWAPMLQILKMGLMGLEILVQTYLQVH
jgi:hypothetical protein